MTSALVTVWFKCRGAEGKIEQLHSSRQTANTENRFCVGCNIPTGSNMASRRLLVVLACILSCVVAQASFVVNDYGTQNKYTTYAPKPLYGSAGGDSYGTRFLSFLGQGGYGSTYSNPTYGDKPSSGYSSGYNDDYGKDDYSNNGYDSGYGKATYGDKPSYGYNDDYSSNGYDSGYGKATYGDKPSYGYKDDYSSNGYDSGYGKATYGDKPLSGYNDDYKDGHGSGYKLPTYGSYPTTTPYPTYSKGGYNAQPKQIVKSPYVVSDPYPKGDSYKTPGTGYGDVVPDYVYPVDVYSYKKQLKCGPEFFFEYENDFSGTVYQEVIGEVAVYGGKAVFKGYGYLAIPFFACNDLLPRYSMSFYIKPDYVDGTRAIIGNSLDPSKASLLLSITGKTLTLVVRQRPAYITPEELLAKCFYYESKRGKRSVPSTYGPSPYGHGKDPYYQDEIVVLQLDIYGDREVLVTIAQEDGYIFLGTGDKNAAKPGRLPTLTNEPLKIGAGADPRGGKPLYYSGTFDSFLFEKCPKGGH